MKRYAVVYVEPFSTSIHFFDLMEEALEYFAAGFGYSNLAMRRTPILLERSLDGQTYGPPLDSASRRMVARVEAEHFHDGPEGI